MLSTVAFAPSVGCRFGGFGGSRAAALRVARLASLGAELLSRIEDAFDAHATRRQRRRGASKAGAVLQVRRVRAALREAGKSAAVAEVGEWMGAMGLRKGDVVYFPEFAAAYYFLFVDSERDGAASRIARTLAHNVGRICV